MNTRSLSTPDYRALAEFRHRLRLFLDFSERAARAAGLEPRQHQLLLAIRGLPELERPTIRTLSRRLGLRHHSAVELVDRAARRGLVVREPGETDRREVLVRVAPAGERMLARLSARHRAELVSSRPRLVGALDALLEGLAARPARRRAAGSR